jgi:D-cysteine desulfhydrase family pyridoxal phosphate-dependent enzyme
LTKEQKLLNRHSKSFVAMIVAFKLDKIPKINLCLLPTPIVPLNQLTDYLGGPRIYMKRDDLTGVAFGGNKNRKLEYLLADALQQGADVIITEGAVNSNHCLQTAACAAKLGLDCELVLSGEEPENITGNFMLFKILGVPIHRVDDSSERRGLMKKREKELISSGKKPYIVPTGGSNAIGALGYVNCVLEVVTQAQQMNMEFTHFVHAAGSSGTQAGMLIGRELYSPKLSIVTISGGISGEFLTMETKQIIRDFEAQFNVGLDLDQISVEVETRYAGPGYEIPSKEMVETVKLVAQLEGVFLDPVYNGKAMVGLIDMIRSEKISKKNSVLFLHSGGGPSIFNYSHIFS